MESGLGGYRDNFACAQHAAHLFRVGDADRAIAIWNRLLTDLRSLPDPKSAWLAAIVEKNLRKALNPTCPHPGWIKRQFGMLQFRPRCTQDKPLVRVATILWGAQPERSDGRPLANWVSAVPSLRISASFF